MRIVNKIICVGVLFLLTSCKTVSTTNVIQEEKQEKAILKLESKDANIYADGILPATLKENLYVFAGDEMEGRETGEPGQKKAAEYLRDQYKKIGIPSPKGIDYFQYIPAKYFNGSAKDSENVLAFIEGTMYPEQVVVISAHYDHIGLNKKGEVFNGADDDGSGTMGILEIAKAFAKAKNEGKGPKRSILFLHVTGEEKGLYGSRYYTENPLFPLDNTVVDLNIDMIGRIDDEHIDNPDYIYLIGSDRLSTELHQLSELVNDTYFNLELDYTFNDLNDPNRFYFRSDHYNFAKNDVPIIFYFNGVHADYHKKTDTPDKIEYELLAKRCKLVFCTAWEIANRKEAIQLIDEK